MSTDDTLRSKLDDILTAHLGIDDMSRYSNDASLWDDLGADDLDLLEISLTIEDEFDVELEEDSLNSGTTIQDVLDLLANKLREQAGQWKS